jgi:hypothetical protein
MLVQLIKSLWIVLFSAKDKEGKERERSSIAYLVFAAWAVALGFLFVSVPQTKEVAMHYEHGDEFKSMAVAIGSEIAPALLLLIALHAEGLRLWQRWTLIILGAPFIAFVLHFQISYYRGQVVAPIEPWELGVIFPLGVLTCAIAVAFLWPLILQNTDKLRVAVDAVEAKWRVILADKDEELGKVRQELDRVADNARRTIGELQKELTGALAKKPEELTAPAKDLSEFRERLVRLGKARLNDANAQEEADRLLAEMEG